MKILVCATRGRGEGWKQHLEIGREEYTNTLTSVAKDNYILEIYD